jgi:hypothetical protein
LRRTKARFVYCFIPNHRAGLVDLSSSTFSANDDSLQVPLLRSQVCTRTETKQNITNQSKISCCCCPANKKEPMKWHRMTFSARLFFFFFLNFGFAAARI